MKDIYTNNTIGFNSPNFRLSVVMGRIPGFTWVDKFGERSGIQTADGRVDIWSYGGEYIYDTPGTAPIESIISDNVADTQDISIQGLDINGDLVNQTVTLTGTTRAALTTPLWRVFRLENEGDTDIAGTVFCYTGTGGVPAASGDPVVRATIDADNNQTQMAMYTVPKGHVGFLIRGEAGSARSQSGGSANGAYYSRRLGGVFKNKKDFDVPVSGTSTYQDVRSFPDPIPAFTDIKLTVNSVTSNNTGVFATFDILLVDEKVLSSDFLKGIAQQYTLV